MKGGWFTRTVQAQEKVCVNRGNASTSVSVRRRKMFLFLILALVLVLCIALVHTYFFLCLCLCRTYEPAFSYDLLAQVTQKVTELSWLRNCTLFFQI